jgi:hypothetical protein
VRKGGGWDVVIFELVSLLSRAEKRTWSCCLLNLGFAQHFRSPVISFIFLFLEYSHDRTRFLIVEKDERKEGVIYICLRNSYSREERKGRAGVVLKISISAIVKIQPNLQP